MEFSEMFNQIETYHKELGFTSPKSEEERMQLMRDHSLALIMEVAELVNSLPWKPWRPLSKQATHFENAIREIVDILFFLGAIMEIMNIPPSHIEFRFKEVLANNYQRILNGYNKKGGDTNG